MDEDKVLRSMRMMAWERAKAELHSMECTFWGDVVSPSSSTDFTKLHKAIVNFVKLVSDNGLHE